MLLLRELGRSDAKVQVEKYDPACERIDTAIKGIWKLWRRGKWVLLAELGLTRREMEALFEEFDAVYITTDHGLIYQEATVHQLIKFEQEKLGSQKILTAAAILIARYIWAFQEERQQVLERKHAA